MTTSSIIRLIAEAAGESGWISNENSLILRAIDSNSELLGSTIDALIAGADAEAIHEYIKSVLVAVSDAEMRREFPGQSA